MDGFFSSCKRLNEKPEVKWSGRPFEKLLSFHWIYPVQTLIAAVVLAMAIVPYVLSVDRSRVLQVSETGAGYRLGLDIYHEGETQPGST